MADLIGGILADRIQTTHTLVLQLVKPLSAAQLTQSPGPTAPPLAWHVWHLARYADLLQASFVKDGGAEIWHTEELSAAWGLNAESLGVMGVGMQMEDGDALKLAQTITRDALLDYAERAFSAAYKAVRNLDVPELNKPRMGLRAFVVEDGSASDAPAEETSIMDNVDFYIAHANRHLGMLEALIGTLFEQRGTATI